MIYVSTGGFHTLKGSEAAALLFESGISHVELSGGQPMDDVFEEILALKSQGSLRVHNYFPPPHVPFALNLASTNPEVTKRSLELCQEAIQLAHQLGDNTYAVHAGFLMDPAVNELGRKIGKKTLTDREQALRLFAERLASLNTIAEPLGIRLLIENNVLSRSNFQEFGENPLLMVTPEETRDFLKSMNQKVGLLVDVAHLKVSAHTLGFDAHKMFELCDPWIEAYHLSDNDGSRDSNDILSQDSWFWPFLKSKVGYYTIEVYGKGGGDLYRQWKLVSECLHKK